MGSPSELTLDYKPTAPHHSLLQKALGEHADRAEKLEEFVARLEEERLKIDAFKRELPLCMLLLNNAMEAYKQQLEACQTGLAARPVLEEFMPLKEQETRSKKQPGDGKAACMATEQLWSQKPGVEDTGKPQDLVAPDANVFEVCPKIGLESKQRNGGGAFLPFSKGKALAMNTVADLALASSDTDVDVNKGEKTGEGNPRTEVAPGRVAVSAPADQPKGLVSSSQHDGQAAPAATHRKARRCWSPDLHRRFVNALQMLGGSQVATPKQIRELMKVEGLTNDEVKSHLQKYRLHTRRPVPAPVQATAVAPPQVVVLGGIWVPPEYAASYGAHPGAAAHYCPGGPVPQEFYVAAAPHHLRHHVAPPPLSVHHRGAITPFRGMRGSPESGGKDGERSESIEDGEDGAGEDEDEDEERRSDGSRGWKVGEEKAREEGGSEVCGGGGEVELKF